MAKQDQTIRRRTRSVGPWCAAFSVLAFFLAYLSPIDYTFADPWGNLLTAQAILEHGTVRLDAYADAAAISDLHLAWPHRRHLYYFFPTGTSVFTVPAVWLASLGGRDMAASDQNSALQGLLSALTVALAFPLIFALCRFFVSAGRSLLLACAFAFGSSTASTLGTALWSSNLTLLFNLLVLVLLVRDRHGPKNASPYLLGLLLFCSYFCRPTAAVLVAVTFAYLGLRRRALLAPAALAFSLPFAAFVSFSLSEYGQWLPPYYSASRLGSQEFATALAGNLVSPSRGLLVLCPYLVLTVLGSVVGFRRLWRDDFFAFGLVWSALHWITISSYPNWWGAWSFGNRLFADALPAVVLLTAVVARTSLGPGSRTMISRRAARRSRLSPSPAWRRQPSTSTAGKVSTTTLPFAGVRTEPTSTISSTGATRNSSPAPRASPGTGGNTCCRPFPRAPSRRRSCR